MGEERLKRLKWFEARKWFPFLRNGLVFLAERFKGKVKEKAERNRAEETC